MLARIFDWRVKSSTSKFPFSTNFGGFSTVLRVCGRRRRRREGEKEEEEEEEEENR